MGFLRRLRGTGGDRTDEDRARGGPDGAGSGQGPRWPRGREDHLPDDEVERERALLRAEAERLDDELIQRQLRYADRCWTPPAEGGERRSDDDDAAAEG
jgi:hypothetical protein